MGEAGVRGVSYPHQDKEGWRDEAGEPLSLSAREGCFEGTGLIHAGPIFLQMHRLPLAILLAREVGLWATSGGRGASLWIFRFSG